MSGGRGPGPHRGLALAGAAASALCAIAATLALGAAGNLSFVDAERDGTGGADALDLPQFVDVSPDGRHVYVSAFSDNSVSVFDRNRATGELAPSGVAPALIAGAADVAVAPDGSSVYVASSLDDRVFVFARDAATGALGLVDVEEDGTGGVDGLDGATGLEVSPDGKLVYVASQDDDAVAVFDRDSASGALAFADIERDGLGGVDGLDGAIDIAIDPRGDNAYVSGSGDDAVAVFSLDAIGRLDFLERQIDGQAGVDGLDLPLLLEVSPDGRHLYVPGFGDDAIVVFSRASGGSLIFGGLLRDGGGSVDGLDGVIAVTVSEDGRHVYSGGAADDSVAVFSRNPANGGLLFDDALRDGRAAETLAGAAGLDVSPDSRHLYVTASADDAVTAFRRELPFRCGGRAATFAGGPGRNVISGTNESDVIVGRGGNDRLRGLDGDDLVCGGPGRDTLRGGAGRDNLRGQNGEDTLLGEGGPDRLLGGHDDDVLRGGPGRDVQRR